MLPSSRACVNAFTLSFLLVQLNKAEKKNAEKRRNHCSTVFYKVQYLKLWERKLKETRIYN